MQLNLVHPEMMGVSDILKTIPARKSLLCILSGGLSPARSEVATHPERQMAVSMMSR
jgi:hypothetical protein